VSVTEQGKTLGVEQVRTHLHRQAAAVLDWLDEQGRLVAGAPAGVPDITERDGRIVVTWPRGRGIAAVTPNVVEGWAGQVNQLRDDLSQAKAERDAAPRQTLLAFADRLDGEIIPDQDGCVAFARDVAEEYPGGAYSGEPSWREENARLMGLLRDIAVARRGGTPPERDCDHEELPGEIRADHAYASRLAEEIESLREALGLQPGEQVCGQRAPERIALGWLQRETVCLRPAGHGPGTGAPAQHRGLCGSWPL
jgi:hypothetical protein